MLTVSRDDDDLFAALRAGASGYLLKDIEPDRLPDALEEVLTGDAAMPGALVAKLVSEFGERGPRRRAVVTGAAEGHLTSREWEVLELPARAPLDVRDRGAALRLSGDRTEPHRGDPAEAPRAGPRGRGPALRRAVDTSRAASEQAPR